MPAIKKPNQHFDISLYNGNSSTQNITGVGFKPDFVWSKSRSTTGSPNALFDVVRGVSKMLQTDGTSGEYDPGPGPGDVTSFNNDGFGLTHNPNSNITNTTGRTYVAWQWKAGGTSVINTSGTISSNVSANPTAGFSIIQFTATGATANVGHSLAVAPQMIIVKDAVSEGNWAVWHTSLTSTAHYLFLNTTAAQANASAIWTGTPSSTTFGIGSWHTADRQIAYCFAPIAGYSAFGSYTGNGSTDGPFIYTGFRPRWFMSKRSTTAGNDWVIMDTSRDTYNVANQQLYADLNLGTETNAAYETDFLSNGFKIRTSTASRNASGDTYIYAAFAESPFKYANAR